MNHEENENLADLTAGNADHNGAANAPAVNEALDEIVAIDGRYKGMNVQQMMSLRLLELAARRLRTVCGATVWISVAVPVGDPVADAQTMHLLGYCVGCDCDTCAETNAAIVKGQAEVIEGFALKGMTKRGEAVTGDSMLEVATREEGDGR